MYKQTCNVFIQGEHRAALFKLSGRINKPYFTVEYTNDSAVICVFYRAFFKKANIFKVDLIEFLVIKMPSLPFFTVMTLKQQNGLNKKAPFGAFLFIF